MIKAISVLETQRRVMLGLESDNEKREKEFVREWQAKSKFAGDHNWRKANGWSGQGDYYPGYDDGEEPKH